MRSDIRLLDSVSIAAPCEADWDGMTPVDGDRVRHCDLCRLNVHNLSDMSRREAEALLEAHAGQRLCVQYAQNPDGTVQTDECPRPLRPVRAAFGRSWAWAASVAAAVTGLLPGATAQADDKTPAPPRTPDEQARPVKRGEALANAPVKIKGDAVVRPAAQDKAGEKPAPPRLGRVAPVRTKGKVAVRKPMPPPVLMGEIAAPPPKPANPKPAPAPKAPDKHKKK